jgi:hypothetical protein
MSLSLRRALLALALVVPLLCSPRSEACGGSCNEHNYHRDKMNECLAGKFGDLARRKQWCRVLAFVQLNGRGWSPEERELVTRTVTRPDNDYYAYMPWTEARAKVPGLGPPPQVSMYWSNPGYYFANCLAGAFEQAAKTLEERMARFGANSAEVASWVEAQDTVFRNCEGVHGTLLPTPATPADPPLLQADRAYQRAAAYFYAADYPRAREHFDAIAQDATSPWRKWARLVAVRSLIREAMVTMEDEAARKPLFEKARARTEAIVKDPDMKELHRQTRALTWFIDARLRPEKQLQLLARVLLERPDENFGIAFNDYFLLREKQKVRTDELSAFIDVFEAPDGYATAREAWKRKKSVAWLVAALRLAHGGDEGLEELLAASRAVPESSPASLMLHIARGRLAVEAGRLDAARAEVLPLLESGASTMPMEASDALSTILMSAARSFEEWAKYAHLSRESFDFFTHGVPLARYTDAKVLAALDPQMRQEVVLAGWTRAVMTDREEVRRALEPLVEETSPGLAPYLARIRERTRPEERRLATLLMLLELPSLSPFVEWPSWGPRLEYERCNPTAWCGRKPLNLYADCEAGKKPCAPRFISPRERAAVQREEQQVEKLGRAPEVLIRAVLDSARKLPRDPLVPEALHRAVIRTNHRHTTYCVSDDDKQRDVRRALSRAAFQLLHRKYGKTEWAQKTPHYF